MIYENMNPSVDWFFSKNSKWMLEYTELRKTVLETGLTEELKWGCPCYTRQNSNILLIHGFKNYCALLFMQGALLTDPKALLIQQTENVQSARQLRFKSFQEITELKEHITAFIEEAIKIDVAGIKVAPKAMSEYKIPIEFQAVLDTNHELNTAFNALTPGRQRGYLLYFSNAKQAKTRETRIEKYIQHILNGKGLED
jgi:uncharacterized protein YdeI (YjbR/CyaY-like superfamily)